MRFHHQVSSGFYYDDDCEPQSGTSCVVADRRRVISFDLPAFGLTGPFAGQYTPDDYRGDTYAARFLYANELGRCSVSSRDLADMHRDHDGGTTILLAHRLEDERQAANWLPCPDGPFHLAFRTYLPRAEIRDGRWTAPPVHAEPRPSVDPTRRG